jgi:hypothetical protein
MDSEPLMTPESTDGAGRADQRRVSMADLFKAPTAGDMDRQLDQIAHARK